MEAQTKQCQSCNNDFTIEVEDFEFYKKMQSPAPNYCWECRYQRRLTHRNERTLYRRKCDVTGKDIVSIYPEDTSWPVYDHDAWWSDDWDGKDFGIDYDPNRPFFDQWKELQSKVPRIGLLSITSVNSDYTNNSADNKNCYLMFATERCEDCLYGRLVQNCKKVVDACFAYDCEIGYELIDCRNCYNCMFVERCQSSSDLLFCFDMRDSQNCIFCVNGRHATYQIYDESVSKEEFESKKSEILSSHSNLEAARKEFEEIKSKAKVKYAFQNKCHNATGDYLYNCHDCKVLFDASNAKSCAYLMDAEDPIDCYDGNNIYYKPELCLDIMGMIQCYQCKFSVYIFYCSGVEYSDSCHNCENCFGCIGLKKDSYCILNKQYSKEEYENLESEIVEKMKQEGVYGDFIPPACSPFGYNETLAKEYYPLEKNEAVSKGFNWQEATSGQFGKETIKTEDMPETIQEVDDSILNEVLVDEATGQNFRVTASEFQFYKEVGLPLPRKSFETRHQARMNKRNPRKLWKRTTDDGQEVWTSYDPDRPEKILSEEAYQKEVN